MPAADGVRLAHQRDVVGEPLAVDRDRPALCEREHDLLGLDPDGVVPEPHAHDRLDQIHRLVQLLELLRLVRGAPDVGVGGVRLLGRRAVRQVAGAEPLRHLVAAAQLLDEVGIEPWLVDAQHRVGEQAVAVEPLDVVALVRRAVAPDGDAVLAHRLHQHRAGDGAAERGGVEVGAAGRGDVEGAALQGDEALVDELLLAVDEPALLGAVVLRTAGDGADVVLVVLAEVGGVRVGDRTALAHPRDGDGRVEPAREGDADAVADGEGDEDLRHGHTLPAGRSPRRRLLAWICDDAYTHAR